MNNGESHNKIKNTRGDNGGTRHLFSFLLDHATPNVFFDTVDKGMAPHVSKYILGKRNGNGTYSNATISRHVVTGFPTSSANSHTSILTGAFAGKNDLIFEKYWNLLGKKPKYIETSKITPDALNAFNKKYINRHCKTLFEHVENSASFHLINRGAKFKLFTLSNILRSFLPIFLKMRKTYEPGAVSPIDNPMTWRKLFEEHIPKYLKKAKKAGHLPNATFIIFLLSDANAHRFGYHSDEYKEAVNTLDYCIQLLVEGFDDGKGKHVDGLKELGYMDSIIWNINTDHSGKLIKRDQYVMINAVMEADLGLRLIDGLEEASGEKPFKRLKGDYTAINGFSSINSEHADFWFYDDGDGLPGPARFLGEKFFRSVVPKNDAFRESREPFDLLEYMLSKEYNQMVIIPEEDVSKPLPVISPAERISLLVPREYELKIISSRGAGKVVRSVAGESACYSYTITTGTDPLDYGDIGLDYGKPHPNRKWLEMTVEHEFPDVFHRLFGMFDSIYAPNLILTSDFNWRYWSRHEVFHKALRNIQSHGGLHAIESIVPATFAGPGIKKGGEIKFARNIDILPTMLRALGIDYDESKLDGKPLDEIFIA
ncbi:MAG: alkaline phosphatase family protein [Promethearchaeota archaeon]